MNRMVICPICNQWTENEKKILEVLPEELSSFQSKKSVMTIQV